MNTAKLYFLGTGTSGGVPSLGCTCEVCQSNDPHDSNIRIAPSFPANSDLELAMRVFTCVVKLVSVKKYLADMDAQAR